MIRKSSFIITSTAIINEDLVNRIIQLTIRMVPKANTERVKIDYIIIDEIGLVTVYKLTIKYIRTQEDYLLNEKEMQISLQNLDTKIRRVHAC